VSDVLVLCYHAVSETWNAALSVKPQALDRQLRSLVGGGWRGATFTDGVLRAPWRRTLVVSFDDAFLSVLEHAYPIMSELGLPGTVFAPTGFVWRRQALSWPGIDHWARTSHASELQSMDWGDLARLSEAGWEIGSHTVTHPRLTELDDEALHAELAGSRQAVAEGHGRDCTSLAYPYGDVDERVAAVAAEAGYSCGASLSSRLTRLGPYRWPRVGIYHVDSTWRFRVKVNAWMRLARSTRLWPAER
jgi:peptidoglycan/xylan/chitin deacetylase (PgdA/CDA1 family)